MSITNTSHIVDNNKLKSDNNYDNELSLNSSIPNDWSKVQLKNIGNTFTGISGKNKDDFGFGKPYIPYLNIFNNAIIKDDHFDYVNIKDNETQEKVRYGDIFFTTSSETPEEVGMCSVYLGNSQELYLNSFCFGFRLTNDIDFSPIYLAELFRSNVGRRTIYKLAQGATRYNLSKTSLLKENIFVPPFKQQQKIAEILSTWDEAIANCKATIISIKNRNKGLAQQLLTGKKRLSGFSDKWEVKPLGDLLIYTPREVDKPDETFLALGLRSHGKGVFHKPDFEPSAIAMTKLYIVKENDLVVNITFAWEQAIAIASKEDEGGLVSHRFPTYTFNPKTASHLYFKFFILQSFFKSMLELISPGGAGRNRVMSKKDFLKLEVKVPKIEEQIAIAQVLEAADQELKSYEAKLEAFQLQKKGLMQQLLTGKIRVNVK